MAGARRMPCGYSAKSLGARRAPAAAIFFRLPADASLRMVGLKPCRAAGRSADGPTGSAPSSGLRSRCAGAPHPAPPNERLRTAPLIERGCEHDLIGHNEGDNFFVVPARQRCGSHFRRERGPTSRQDPSPCFSRLACGSPRKAALSRKGRGCRPPAPWSGQERGRPGRGRPCSNGATRAAPRRRETPHFQRALSSPARDPSP